MKHSTGANAPSPRLGKAPEAAELLRVEVSTVYAWAERDRIPHIRLGRALRFDMDRLERWVAEQSVEPGCRR